MRRALKAIEAHWSEEGIAPTCRELADRLGLASQTAILEMLSRLERRGLIRRLPNKPRTLRLTEAGVAEGAAA
jgi:repressor LexA